MNAPDGAGFLLALDAVWLGALAIGAVMLRREVAILRRRVMLAGQAVPDGLEVGSPVPRDADPATDRVLLFVYPHCEPCEELAPRLRFLSSPELLDVVVSGGDPHEPPRDLARDVAEELRIDATPVVVLHRDGYIVASAIGTGVRDREDIDRLWLGIGPSANGGRRHDED